MTLNSAAPKAPTLIHILGRANVKAVAERAALTIRISDRGSDKGEISANAVVTVKNIQNQLDQLCSRLENGDLSPSSPITFYSIATLSVSTGNDFDNEGHQSDPDKKLYTAESTINVHFRDFSILGDIVVRLSSMKFVGLEGVEWQLTDAKQAWLDEEVRVQAVKNAMDRAQAYARILGREKVTCIKIEDADEYWNPRVGRARQTARRAADVEAFTVGAGIQFEPENVEVSGTVKVDFHAE